VFIDLDRFKPVNDLLGHEAGDELLRVVAQRLRQVVRPGDVVARIGGDEFGVLALDVLDRVTGQSLAERIDSTLAMPYLLTDGPVRLTASVGVALADEEATVTGLLADADLAMYDAKAARRGEPPRSDSQRLRSSIERRRLADELVLGLERGEVMAYLQPIVALGSGATTGFEALVRWQHPELGVLSPASFLDLAEDAGLDLLLGDVLLQSACATLAKLPDQIRLNVNLSVAQLADHTFTSRVRTILEHHGLSPRRLVVEITEHATLARRPGGGRVSPERTLDELRSIGVALCLDDFGTGYSSLTHIRRYPLSSIKVDRSFVDGVNAHAEDRAVIAAMVGMAEALRLQIVAEGVETGEQLTTLAALGCQSAQGYYISRPLPPDEVAQWMSARGADWRSGRTLTASAN
jgi:diguanylate cyclase (GGDEF)-like protein